MASEEELDQLKAHPPGWLPNQPSDLESEIRSAINRYSAENGSNTPDFILANYLMSCLQAWNVNVNARELWYGREPRLIGTGDKPPDSVKI